MANLSDIAHEGFKILLPIIVLQRLYKGFKGYQEHKKKKEAEQGGKPYSFLQELKDDSLNNRVKKLLIISFAISAILVTFVLIFAR